ncbi:MAG: transporter [Myxococcota bacterium]|nr:transporter [Myxococcota bacterium]
MDFKLLSFKRTHAPERRRGVGAIGLMFALVIAVTPVIAEEGATALELIGDRPDFTESAATIPPLHLQSELGVAYSTIGDEKTLTAPNLLLRLGLIEHLEARLGVPAYEASFVGDSVDADVSGVELGLKAAFDVGDNAAIGVLPYAVMPIYEGQWSDTGLELGIKGVWSVDVTDALSLGGNAGVIFEGVAPAEVAFEPIFLLSLSLGVSLNEWLGAFAEVYGLMNTDADLIPVADGGLTFLVTQWLQFDLHAGVGLTPDAQGFDVGGGAIFLF